MLLETNTKFKITSPNRERAFSPEFSGWSNTNMYRTSYNDMRVKSPVDKKTYAIPKYQGYIPGKDAESELGKGFTKISRRCFSPEKLDEKETLFGKTLNFQASTQNLNFKTLKQDQTLEAATHKYGKPTMSRPHPCIADSHWSTTFRKTYVKPTLKAKPNAVHRASTGDLLFDPKMRVSQRPGTQQASGFENNA